MINLIKRHFCGETSVGGYHLSDFHSHLLPGMDDGSSDEAETLRMLDMMAQQGVEAVVATPHFYADSETPDSFLERREAAVQRLLNVYDPEKHPSVYVGAEVLFFNNMGRCEQLRKLCILGTDFILIEMPFFKWDRSVVNEISAIRDVLGLIPIIAHIERYISEQKKSLIAELIENDMIVQSNAEFFIEKRTSRLALKMLESGAVNLLGSDCHNSVSRIPDMGEAMAAIKGKVSRKRIAESLRLEKKIFSSAKPVALRKTFTEASVGTK